MERALQNLSKMIKARYRLEGFFPAAIRVFTASAEMIDYYSARALSSEEKVREYLTKNKQYQ